MVINCFSSLVCPLAINLVPKNIFGKAIGRKLYCNTATTDNAAEKHYLEFYMIAIVDKHLPLMRPGQALMPPIVD